jgi:predicted RNA-binding protein YlxR (DUF448 family)
VKKGHVPIRTCVGCLRRRPKRDLLRLALTARGVRAGACGGRGLYLCRSESCLDMAWKRKSLGRHLARRLSNNEVAEIREMISGQNGLDGEGSEGVICCNTSGGIAVA